MQLEHPRYCDTPFPPYRFIPGRHPHPTAHPDGHSYLAPGEPHPHVEFFPPSEWRRSPDYLYGCDLYNHGYWWEAHEAWEGLWQLTDKRGPQGQFLQGVIQVAACHLQLLCEKRDGVQRLRRTSAAHLGITLAAMTEPTYMGLELRPWLARVDACFERALGSDGRGPHDPTGFPYITLNDA